MKEREIIELTPIKSELTQKLVNSTLEAGGDIFMSDGTSNGPERPPREIIESKPIKPEITMRGSLEKRREAARAFFEGENRERTVSLDELGTQRKIIEAGIMPMAGGSDEEPKPDKSSQQEDAERERALEQAKKAEAERGRARRDFFKGMGANISEEDIVEFEKQLMFAASEEAISLNARRASAEHKQIGVPNSLEDLAKLIMKSSTPEWGRNGTKALISKDSEGRDRVNTVNFLDWSRNNRLRVHNANPTSPINFFSDIGTSVRNDVYGSQISFYEIVFTESIFLDKTIENGKEVTKKNDDYEALRHQLLMETFLFSVVRNPDVTYFLNRGQGDKMLKALEEAFVVNPLTRGDFFEFIFTMPSMHKKSITDLEAQSGTEIQAKQEGNFYMGDAAREALAAYMNIFDYEQLVKILGSDAPLFQRDYESWDTDSGERKFDDEAKTQPSFKSIEADVEHPDKRRNDWFNPDGSIKLGRRNPTTRRWEPSVDGKTGVPDPGYMSYVNVFLSPSPDQRQQAEIKNRIVLSIMKKNGISYREAQEAELWAHSMTHIHGVAAEMDTDAVAFDWWTRLVRFKEYRKRQKADKRGAPYGGNHNLEGFKRIGLTFFEAARDIRGRSIKSIIQGGTGRSIDIEGNPLKNNVDYEWNYARDGDGDIVFVDKQKKTVKTKVKKIDVEDKKFRFLDVDNKDVDVRGLTPKKSNIIFRDLKGNVVDVGVRATKYVLGKDGEVVFRDENENDISDRVGEYRPKVIITNVDAPVQFKADLQKQFHPNHIHSAARVYEFIMSQVGLNLPELVTGYDARGNPTIDQAKLLEIKAKIEHDIRYSLSTWPEINYGEKDVRAESVEVRNNKGRLVAKKRGPNDEEQELDENWYVYDTRGKRTSERNEPVTYLRSREMTVLESMFGVDALKHIQFEIERHDLANGKKENEDDFINAKDERGNEVRVDISAANSTDETTKHQFSIAVWQGAFDYLIAAEIEAHRDRNSGLRYYDSTDIKKSSDAMIVGELATPDRVKNIRKETNTRARRVYSQDFSYAFATGGASGMWKVFEIMLKDILSGK